VQRGGVVGFDQRVGWQLEGGFLSKTVQPWLTAEQADDLGKRVACGEKKAVLVREFGISRETLYQYQNA
jgi:helix-turn-helix resolvase-like protein